VRLDIGVAPGCHGCDEARAIACGMRARFPDVAVSLIELDGRRSPPANVVATPTYLLDGRVVSLGNPTAEQLAHEIARRRRAAEAQP
jgi:hypothetical protein